MHERGKVSPWRRALLPAAAMLALAGCSVENINDVTVRACAEGVAVCEAPTPDMSAQLDRLTEVTGRPGAEVFQEAAGKMIHFIQPSQPA